MCGAVACLCYMFILLRVNFKVCLIKIIVI